MYTSETAWAFIPVFWLCQWRTSLNFPPLHLEGLFIYLFWGDWGLNSGLYACIAGELESQLQFIFALVILEMDSLEPFIWTGPKLQFSQGSLSPK
jgi:hypothetical protein